MDDRATHVKNQNGQSDLSEEVIHLAATIRNDRTQLGPELPAFCQLSFHTFIIQTAFHTDLIRAAKVGNEHKTPFALTNYRVPNNRKSKRLIGLVKSKM